METFKESSKETVEGVTDGTANEVSENTTCEGARAPRLKLSSARRGACPYPAALPPCPGPRPLKELKRPLLAAHRAGARPRARVRAGAGAGAGPGAVGCVWQPPGAGERVRRRQWPARGMHERPEWPRAGDARSPTPPAPPAPPAPAPPPPPAPLPQQTQLSTRRLYGGGRLAQRDDAPAPAPAAPAALALRRSMQMALHAALAYGAEVLQDMKEEIESCNHLNSPPSGKNLFIPQALDQYYIHQADHSHDVNSLSQNFDSSHNSDGISLCSVQMSDRETSSEPLDLSEESDESDSCETKGDPPVSAETSYTHGVAKEDRETPLPVKFDDAAHFKNNIQESKSKENIYLQPTKPLLDEANTSSWSLSCKSPLKPIDHNKGHRVPFESSKQDKDDDNDGKNIFLVTGHFDESNTFCITSSTEYKNSEEGEEKALTSHISVDKHIQLSAEDVPDYKFSSPHELLRSTTNNIPNWNNINVVKFPQNELKSSKLLKRDNTVINTSTIDIPWIIGSNTSSSNRQEESREAGTQLTETSVNSFTPAKPTSSVPIFVKSIHKRETTEINPKVVIVPVPQENSYLTSKCQIEESTSNSKMSPDKQILIRDKNTFVKSNFSLNQPRKSSLSNAPDTSSCAESQNKTCTQSGQCSFSDSSEFEENTISTHMETSSGMTYITLPREILSHSEQTPGSSSENSKKRKLPCTTLLLEESDNLLHIFSVRNSEDNFPEKLNNSVPCSKANDLVNCTPTNNLGHGSQEKEISTLQRSEKSENCLRECSTDHSEKLLDEHENADNTNIEFQASKYSRFGSSNLHVEHSGGTSSNSTTDDTTLDNHSENQDKRVSNVVDSLLPFILQRAMHYCMICDVAPEDLLTYLNSLPPASIPDWLE